MRHMKTAAAGTEAAGKTETGDGRKTGRDWPAGRRKTDVFCTAGTEIEEILKTAAEDQKADARQLQTAKDRLDTFQREPEKKRGFSS